MMKKIVLGLMLGVSVLTADFVRSGEHVTDTITGLMWQDDTLAAEVNIFDWPTAITQCEGLSLDGHSDWRLPNINELYSIVDQSRTGSISSVFQNKVSLKYWSSTTDANISAGRLVDFSIGNDFGEVKTLQQFVRCVRGGE